MNARYYSSNTHVGQLIQTSEPFVQHNTVVQITLWQTDIGIWSCVFSSISSERRTLTPPVGSTIYYAEHKTTKQFHLAPFSYKPSAYAIDRPRTDVSQPTFRYSGSTFSINECNSRILQQLFFFLFLLLYISVTITLLKDGVSILFAGLQTTPVLSSGWF